MTHTPTHSARDRDKLCRSCGWPALLDAAGQCSLCGHSIPFDQLALPGIESKRAGLVGAR
jgi:hypothetical protein